MKRGVITATNSGITNMVDEYTMEAVEELNNVLDQKNDKIQQLEQRLKDAELCIESIYNIDAKFLDTDNENNQTMWLSAIFDESQKYLEKYKKFKTAR